jgi:DNA-binding response OmpR family regulator
MERILVVDDDNVCRELVKQILEQEGMMVHCVASGEEALGEMSERTFLLMITDLNMPGLDGFELARKARGMASRMPIVMSTGDLSPEIPQLALEAGIEKLLVKPFSSAEMVAVVMEAVRTRGGD